MLQTTSELSIGLKLIEVAALLLPLVVLMLQLVSRSDEIDEEIEASAAQMMTYAVYGLYFTAMFGLLSVSTAGVSAQLGVALLAMYGVFITLSAVSIDISRNLAATEEQSEELLATKTKVEPRIDESIPRSELK